MEKINISNIKTIEELKEIKNKFSCISELISTLIYLELASSYGKGECYGVEE